MQDFVVRAIHRTHAALPNLGDDAVVPEHPIGKEWLAV